MKNQFGRLTAIVGIAAALAVVLTMGASAQTSKNGTLKSGGVLRVGWEGAFGFDHNGDPTGEYTGEGIGVFTNLEVRTLVGYMHTAGAAGNTIVPDLATTVPKPTNGGKTYTFHLKSNIKFSPPVNREITSQDFVTALDRVADPKNSAGYGFYYSVIKGWTAYAAGKAKTITGISTPNATTIVFNLTQPTGDFLDRISMPAAGPQPAEVANCFNGQPGKYGQDLISSGPYMLNGIDKIDISSCAAIKPDTTGFDGQTIYDVVRNPNYVQSTDNTRKNYVDEVRFTVDSSNVDIYNKIEAGQLDLAESSIPPDVLQKYATNASLKSHFFQNSADRLYYLMMNLTQPPFDDIHVRKAMNWIMDKAALVQAWGGPTVGQVANHIVPDSIFQNQIAEFAPYKTAGNHGSLAKAEAAMKGSKYSTGNDGKCDASQCKNILMIADSPAQYQKMIPVVEQSAAKIGITFKVQTVSGAYPTIETVAKNIPFSDRPGWGKDYADALTFFEPLFDSRNIIPAGNTDFSLVGITPAQCKKFKVTGNCTGIPSVNPQLDKCSALTGQARLSCYEALDKTLMTTVVPWVPYIWNLVTRITASDVTHYQFDQFSGTPAYANISVQ